MYFLLLTPHFLRLTSHVSLPTSDFLLLTSYILLPTSYFSLPASLRDKLRSDDMRDDILRTLLSPTDADWVSTQRSRPLAILSRLRALVHAEHRAGRLDSQVCTSYVVPAYLSLLVLLTSLHTLLLTSPTRLLGLLLNFLYILLVP